MYKTRCGPGYISILRLPCLRIMYIGTIVGIIYMIIRIMEYRYS